MVASSELLVLNSNTSVKYNKCFIFNFQRAVFLLIGKMAANFVKFFVLFVFVVADLNAQSHEGESCVLQRTGASGVCSSLRTCVPARYDLRKRLVPQNCGFSGTMPIVCCVLAHNGSPPATSPSETVTLPPRPTNCPPLPEGAIKVQKTGQKAWDYCIDLSETVYPCSRKGFLVSAMQIRRFECDLPTNTPLLESPVMAGEFPHMVLLGFSNDPIQWDCSGTLISKDWVMTSARCTFKRDAGSVTHIRLGGGDSNSTLEAELFYRVAEIVPHPEFVAPSVYNDIALLRTDRSVKFSSRVRPACLHTGNPVNDEKIIATGWGATSSRGSKSNSLLKETLEKFNYEECSAKNPPNRRSRDGVRDKTQFCAGHRREFRDACQDDSGGPLQIYNDAAVQCTYLVIAVSSYGKTCGIPGQPAVYTRVSAFIPWIEDTVWPNGF